MTRDELEKAGFEEHDRFSNPRWTKNLQDGPIRTVTIKPAAFWDAKGYVMFYTVYATGLLLGECDGTVILHNEGTTIKESMARLHRIFGDES